MKSPTSSTAASGKCPVGVEVRRDPPPWRVSRLRRLDDVRAELARVYRQARADQLPVEKAKAFAYLLQVLSGLLKDTELERRIAALEKTP
jgi:hypothetical protein